MKDKRIENERIENLLRRAGVPKASTELKERITAEARKAWRQTSGEVSWRIPFGRLAASAAAMVLIVCLTDYSSDRALDKWQSGESFVVERSPAGLETLPGMPYSPFAKHLATVNRKPSVIDASALRDHVENVRRAIDESQRNGTPVSPAPPGRSSRLLPGRHSAGSYS